jgi:hypothetical protein
MRVGQQASGAGAALLVENGRRYLGASLPAYRVVDAHLYDRVQNFLCRRHNVSRRGTNSLETLGFCILYTRAMDARRGSYGKASRKARHT